MALESDFLTIISQVGFPIFITLWFMFRTEKIIQANTDATNKMILILESNNAKV